MKLRISGRAKRELEHIDTWWRANRDASDLFTDEFEAVIRLVRKHPQLGRPQATETDGWMDGWYGAGTMTEAAEKLLAEAMKLTPEERERLGKQLLDSADAANDEMDAQELAALDNALDESERQFTAGEGREFFSAVAELRAQS